MRRKLIKQGNPEHGSYTITLPSAWIQKFSLKAGDEVNLGEIGNSLVINSEKAIEQPKTVVIDTRNYTHVGQYWKNISEVYRLGAETIKVIYQNKKIEHKKTGRTVNVKDEIELITTTLLGMEMEKATQDTITITQFGEILEKEFDSALRKIFFKLEEITDHTINALETMDPDALKSGWFVDRGLNKLYNFCMRVLNKRGYSEYKKTIQVTAAVVQLELLGDMITQTSYITRNLKLKKVRKEVIDSLKELKKAIELYSRYFYEHKEEHARKLIDMRGDFYSMERASMKFDAGNAAIISWISSCFGLIMNMQDSAVTMTEQKI